MTFGAVRIRSRPASSAPASPPAPASSLQSCSPDRSGRLGPGPVSL